MLGLGFDNINYDTVCGSKSYPDYNWRPLQYKQPMQDFGNEFTFLMTPTPINKTVDLSITSLDF